MMIAVSQFADAPAFDGLGDDGNWLIADFCGQRTNNIVPIMPINGLDVVTPRHELRCECIC